MTALISTMEANPFSKAYHDAMKLLKKHEKETQAIIMALAMAAATAGIAEVNDTEDNALVEIAEASNN